MIAEGIASMALRNADGSLRPEFGDVRPPNERKGVKQ